MGGKGEPRAACHHSEPPHPPPLPPPHPPTPSLYRLPPTPHHQCQRLGAAYTTSLEGDEKQQERRVESQKTTLNQENLAFSRTICVGSYLPKCKQDAINFNYLVRQLILSLQVCSVIDFWVLSDWTSCFRIQLFSKSTIKCAKNLPWFFFLVSILIY